MGMCVHVYKHVLCDCGCVRGLIRVCLCGCVQASRGMCSCMCMSMVCCVFIV